jgi:hypothetical protein
MGPDAVAVHHSWDGLHRDIDGGRYDPRNKHAAAMMMMRDRLSIIRKAFVLMMVPQRLVMVGQTVIVMMRRRPFIGVMIFVAEIEFARENIRRVLDTERMLQTFQHGDAQLGAERKAECRAEQRNASFCNCNVAAKHGHPPPLTIIAPVPARNGRVLELTRYEHSQPNVDIRRGKGNPLEAP